jgi:hypothetical protein
MPYLLFSDSGGYHAAISAKTVLTKMKANRWSIKKAIVGQLHSRNAQDGRQPQPQPQ